MSIKEAFMKTYFELEKLLKEKKLTVIQLAQQIANSGKSYNPNSLYKIKNNTIKQISVDTIADICLTLDAHPDEWIKVLDSPIPLTGNYRINSEKNVDQTIILNIDSFLKEKNWTQKKLHDWLDEHKFSCRPSTISDLCSNRVDRLRVDLIAPISVALGTTPGSWISVQFHKKNNPINTGLFNLQPILKEKLINLEELVIMLDAIKVSTDIAELTAIYENKTNIIRPELLLGINRVLNIVLEDWISS